VYSVDEETLKKVAGLFGEDALRIVESLQEVGEITDIDIANKTQIPLKIIRKILYSLYDHSLVGLRQTRDKTTGWFIFNWRLQPDQLQGFVLNQKRHILEKLKARLDYEKSHEFYFCQTPDCRRYSFEEALEFLFKCPVCSKPLNHFNNDLFVKALTKKIEEIKGL
jgi:transcription initiation factor TFIIE subunit alpha